MSKVDKIERELLRAEQRIFEWQTKTKELETKLTEAENTEIVAAVRALKMTRAEIRAFTKTGRLPSTLADKPAITPARFVKKPEPAKQATKPADVDKTGSFKDNRVDAAAATQKPAAPDTLPTIPQKTSEDNHHEAA